MSVPTRPKPPARILSAQEKQSAWMFQVKTLATQLAIEPQTEDEWKSLAYCFSSVGDNLITDIERAKKCQFKEAREKVLKDLQSG